MRRALALTVAFAALPCCALAAELPRGQTLEGGWEVRAQQAAPAPPQPPPPVEGQPEGAPNPPTAAVAQRARVAQGPFAWTSVQVPSVFNPSAVASEYAGRVQRYRVRFTAPATPRGFRWLVRFESVRRSTAVYLNGRRLGRLSLIHI